MSEVERESMEFDVVIVGAGPAGLAAAIRLKQVNPELSVVVLEKGGEVGAHILSGAVVDPVGMDRLLPDWRDDPDHPFKTEVKDDHFLLLGPVPADYQGSMTDYAALKKAGVPVLGWGSFVTEIVSFVILAFIIFLMIKAANKAMRKGPDAAAGPSEVDLLTEIRDELRKR